MSELVTYDYGNYGQFKEALDKEILSAAESFVKIGYLLKQARDTNILRESGYENLYEFAKAEYGIDKGTVSRYIAINDRFSIGGNAPALENKYSGRGVAKLQEMLTLSDEVIDVIPAETSKAEIQEIKRDIKEEQEKTDIEVMLEEEPIETEAIELDSLAKQSLYYHLKDDKEAFKRVCECYKENDNLQLKVMKALAPSGVATPRARVPKVGTILMSIQGLDNEMQFVNIRTNEKESRSWQYITDALFIVIGLDIQCGVSIAEKYEKLYGEKFEKVAPVQQENKETVTETEENKEIVSKEKEWEAMSEPEETENGENTIAESDFEQESEEKQQITDEKERENGENIIAESDFEPKSEEEQQITEEKEGENGENTIAETNFEQQEEKEEIFDEKIEENGENIIADAEYKEVKDGFEISMEEHNQLMQIAEDIKKALFEQDYEEAQFKANSLSRLIELQRNKDE